MGTNKYGGNPVAINMNSFSGGLNSTSGPLSLQDNESSDLQNIDFDIFGSMLQRNGYTRLNSEPTGGTPRCDGLYWFEFESSGATTRMAVKVEASTLLKMDGLDGAWDDVTGAVTITSTNHCTFDTFLNTVMITNNVNPPFSYDGGAAAAAMDVPTNLTKAKFVTQYQNYALYANVEVDGTRHQSRWYWSAIKDTTSWSATDFIETSKNDGQAVTGFKVLGEFLIVYKERSIYKYGFTGDVDVPFILIGKVPGDVGCVAPYSIQEGNNGHIFLAYDGIYYFDGNNTFKVSDRINTTINGLNRTRFSDAKSSYQNNKNKYQLALTSSGASTNDKVITWDTFNNALSVYDGMSVSAMATFVVSGVDERPYFDDYLGYTYRSDFGTDDHPLGVTTAISAFYWTNWRTYGDQTSQKSVPNTYLYHQISSSELTISHSYDFESGEEYSQSVDLAGGGSAYGSAVYGTGTYGKDGGNIQQLYMEGRGRVVRYRFGNDDQGQKFQVDGFGQRGQLETNN